MRVNGLSLPELLCKLLQSECWQKKLTVKDLEKTFGIVPESDFNFLGLDLTAFLASNWDEDAIVLDYRNNLENPRVLWQLWSSNNQDRTRWVEIAVSFQEFALKLNLP